MSNNNVVDDLASSLLQDIEAVYGYAQPGSRRWPFEYLQPYYADSRETNLVQRLLAAYGQLEFSRQVTFRLALMEALERCVNDFHGSASRMLAILDLNCRLNRDAMDARLWSRMIDCRDPENPQMTERLLEGLVSKFKSWSIKPDIRSLSWRSLIAEISIAALPEAGEWLLSLAKHSLDISVAIFCAVWQRAQAEREALQTYWPEAEEVYTLLFTAFLPEVQNKEKAAALQNKGVPAPHEIAGDMETQLNELKADVQSYFAGYSQEDMDLEQKWQDIDAEA